VEGVGNEFESVLLHLLTFSHPEKQGILLPVNMLNQVRCSIIECEYPASLKALISLLGVTAISRSVYMHHPIQVISKTHQANSMLNSEPVMNIERVRVVGL
jgi:hypothetical protein